MLSLNRLMIREERRRRRRRRIQTRSKSPLSVSPLPSLWPLHYSSLLHYVYSLGSVCGSYPFPLLFLRRKISFLRGANCCHLIDLSCISGVCLTTKSYFGGSQNTKIAPFFCFEWGQDFNRTHSRSNVCMLVWYLLKHCSEHDLILEANHPIAFFS